VTIDTDDVTESQTPPVLVDLSALEQRVINAAHRGGWASPDVVIPVEELATIDDSRLRVRAELLRELLIGRRGVLDPRRLRIRGVRIDGQLDLDYVTAVAELSLADCVLPDGMTCIRTRLRELNLNGTRLLSLNAVNLRTDGNVHLRGIIVSRATDIGAVQLTGAQIGGQLNLDHAEITNTTGPALHADGLHVHGDTSLQNSTFRGTGKPGTVRLSGAQISGQLNLDHAEITNTTGPALHADGLRTDSSTSLRDATLRGTGKQGAVRLSGAQISGQLNLNRAEITNDSGPALHAGNLHTDSSVYLMRAIVSGTGEQSALRLIRAHIGGQLHLDEIQVDNESGRLVALTEARVIGVLILPPSLVCSQGRAETSRSECPDGKRRITVGGLVFPALAEVSWRQWLHLLMHHTPAYEPQPYQQLATVERASGHDNNARQILIAQQEDLRRRTPEAIGGWLARRRHWLWGWLGRYGYRAHRLVTALVLVLALAAGLGYIAGQVPTRPGHHAAERVQPLGTPTDSPGTPCSTAELIGLGIDRGLPLGVTGLRTRCDLDTSTKRGQAFTYAAWALQALVWALATLAIAAYTGLVRKPA
jgi:hypothetical protein